MKEMVMGCLKPGFRLLTVSSKGIRNIQIQLFVQDWKHVRVLSW